MYITIFVIFVLTLLGCGREKEIKVYESILQDKVARLDKIGEIHIKEAKNKYIGDFRPGTTIIRFGKFFIADRFYPKIWVINMDGRIEKHIGGKLGKGPGEIIEIGSFDVTDNGLVYIFDQGNRRISCFDTAGNFYFSFQFPSEVIPDVKNIKVYGDKILFGALESRYSGLYEKHKSRILAVFDLKGNFVEMFGIADKVYQRFHYGGPTARIDFDSLGRIYVAQWATYRIYRYDTNFRLDKIFGVKGLFREAKEDIPIDAIMNIPKLMRELMKSSGTGSLRVKNGYVFYSFHDLTEKTVATKNYLYNDMYLKVYDIEGNYIKSDIKLSGEFLDVDNGGRVYIYESNEPGKRRIGVYRLIIEGS